MMNSMDVIDSGSVSETKDPKELPIKTVANGKSSDSQQSSADVKFESNQQQQQQQTVANSADRRSPTSLSSVSNLSSTSSSSLAQEPFRPRYTVKVSSNSVTKDGESVIYNIITTSLMEDSEGKQWNVTRVYEDFIQLNHVLTASVYPGFGLIMPPLPDEPTLNPQQVQEKSREKLGPNTRILIGDEWYKDCWQLQEYLRLLLTHPVFGHDTIWEQFLCSVNAPPQVKLKKSSNILVKFTENMDTRARVTHKDCEEYFQKERDWSNSYSAVIKQTSEAFNSIINARLKLCGSLSHLSTALNLNIPGSNETTLNRRAMKFGNLFSIAIDDYKRGLEVINYNDESTLGSSLELWSHYLEAEKEMLLRRTGLMIDYEKSNRNLDKAKPNKKEEVR